VTLPDARRFGLARALAISLIVHILLLWPSTPAWQSPAITPVLQGTLRPVSPEVIVANAIAPTPPVIAPNATKRKTTERKESSSTEQPLRLTSAETQAAIDVNSTQKAVSRSDSASPASAASLILPVPTGSSLAPAEGVDPEGLRSYRLALAREARPYKRYTHQANEAGWVGTVELRVSVRVGGIAQAAELTKSSGHATLDDAALEMLQRALPATPLPPTLQGQAFAVTLPVVFELPD
jgi:periplasmic protein TonB